MNTQSYIFNIRVNTWGEAHTECRYLLAHDNTVNVWRLCVDEGLYVRIYTSVNPNFIRIHVEQAVCVYYDYDDA